MAIFDYQRLVLTKTKDVEVEEFRHGVFSCFEDCTP
jgi:hypothetical protein